MSTYVDLLKACKEGNHKRVKRLLSSCQNISDVRDLTDRTLLHYCFKHELCSDLILEEAPELLNVGDRSGYTILHLASMMKPPTSLNYVLSKNPDINKCNNDSRTPLLLAVIYDNIEAIELLCKHGANVNAIDSNGISSLHYIAKSKSDDNENNDKIIIDLLLKYKANIDINDIYNRTPLMWAICSNNITKTRYFINSGANLQLRDSSGLSVLHYAASNGNNEIIGILLNEYKFDIECRDKNNCTPLMYACTMENISTLKLLLSKGADPNLVDYKKRNSAHFACSKGKLDHIKILSKYNANLWPLNIDNNYPLHEAAYRGYIEIVQYIIDNITKKELIKDLINQKNSNNQTPLHLAAVKDHIDICKILVEKGADTNICLRASNGKSMTALDLSNNIDTKSLLIRYGAKTAENLIKAPIKEMPDTEETSDSEDSYLSSSSDTSKSLSDKSDKTVTDDSQNNQVDKLDYSEPNNDFSDLDSDDILSASMSGRIRDIEFYQKRKGSLTDIIDKTGKTLFHYSLKQDNSFEFMCKKYPTLVNKRDKSLITPFMLAVMSHSNSRILPLLKLGADLNCCDQTGRTALHYCIIYQNLQALLLIQNYVTENPHFTINHTPDNDGQYPLHYVVELIISNTTLVNKLDYIKVLLDLNPDIECLDKFNRTPLLLAVNAQSVEAVDIILDYSKIKPNIYAKDKQGLTCFHYICAQGNIKILELFVKHLGIDLNLDIPDPNGLTPIFYAVAACNDKLLIRLIELKAKLNIVDNQKRSLCHKAAEKCAFLCLTILIANGVDPWLDSIENIKPIHEAAYRGYKEIADILLKSNSDYKDVNAKNSSGQTALHLAVARNDCPMCFLLIQNGANVNDGMWDSNSNSYKNPLDLATTSYCRELLIKYGAKSANKTSFNKDDDDDENESKKLLLNNKDSDSNDSLIIINKLDEKTNLSNDYIPFPSLLNSTRFSVLESGPTHSLNNAKDSEYSFNIPDIEENPLLIDMKLMGTNSGTDIDNLKGTIGENNEENQDDEVADKNGVDDENNDIVSPLSNGTETKITKNEDSKLSSRESSSITTYTTDTTRSSSSSNKNMNLQKIPQKLPRAANNKKPSQNPSSSSSKPIKRYQSNSTITPLPSLQRASTNLKIEQKVQNSIVNYEYMRFNAQIAIELARQKIRKENIEKLLNPTTPKEVRRKKLIRPSTSVK